MPGWMRHVAAVNPVNWAVEAGRRRARPPTWTWSAILRGVGLAVLAVAAGALAARAFR